MKMRMKEINNKLKCIKVPHTIKKSDVKLYLAFCMEHVKETDTPDDIEKMWKQFKKSIKNAAKSVIERSKEL